MKTNDELIRYMNSFWNNVHQPLLDAYAYERKKAITLEEYTRESDKQIADLRAQLKAFKKQDKEQKKELVSLRKRLNNNVEVQKERERSQELLKKLNKARGTIARLLSK